MMIRSTKMAFWRSGAAARPLAPTAQLSLAAVSIALLFGILLVGPFPLWATQPPRPPSPGTPPSAPVGWPGLVITAVFLVAMCLPFRAYALALRAVAACGARPAASHTRVLLGLTALLGVVALLIYPAFGSDIFDYAGFERLWTVYGDNPLLAEPVNHPADWASALVWYPDRTPAYGPLWAMLTWPIVRLAGDSPALLVAGYKLLAGLAYAACGWLIWTSAAPADRQRAFVMFSWSPLILFEVLGKVHNDVLPALSMLSSVWLVARAPRLSLPAAVAGGLIKATALPVAPAVALFLWRHGRWRALLPAAAAALVLLVLLYLPFWAGPATLVPLWSQTSHQVWSPMSVLGALAAWLSGGPAFDTPLRFLLGLAWLAACALVLRRSRLHTLRELAATALWLLLATVLLLTSAVYAHYFVPAVALAAVSGNARLQRLVMWLSLGGLAAYGTELLGLVFGSAWLGSAGYRVLGTLILLGPAAVALTLELIRPTARAATTHAPIPAPAP